MFPLCYLRTIGLVAVPCFCGETDVGVLFTIAGGVMLASFNNMAMLFLGIEILSISLYVLAGSKKDSLYSNEVAFKYGEEYSKNEYRSQDISLWHANLLSIWPQLVLESGTCAEPWFKEN